MKRIIGCFLFLTFSIVCTHAQSPPSATEVLRQSYQRAAREKKKVIIIFHASWCGWCHKMDSSINSADCKAFFDKYYVISHLTVDELPAKKALENGGAKDLLIKYGGGEQGIPYWLVLDSDGKLLADSQIRPGVNTGCPAKKEEVEYFLTVLKKTSGLTQKELAIIGKRFSQNDVQ